ncbi:Tas retrotransposon peptidase A16 [Ostertagia ostertagi]
MQKQRLYKMWQKTPHVNMFQNRSNVECATPQKPMNVRKDSQKKTTQIQHNLAICEEEDAGNVNANLTVMKVENTTKNKPDNSFLLTGNLNTVHPGTQQPMKLHVLLDTGADRSFIDVDLAEELQLPKHNVVAMKLCTFGEKQPKEIRCIETDIKVWDSTGLEHNLRVYTHENFSKNYRTRRLGEEDLQYISDNNLVLSAPNGTNIKPPQILIGCDHLWEFIEFEKQSFILPSGLILVPTRLGYMVSGKQISHKGRKHAIDSSFQMIESWQQN